MTTCLVAFIYSDLFIILGWLLAMPIVLERIVIRHAYGTLDAICTVILFGNQCFILPLHLSTTLAFLPLLTAV